MKNLCACAILNAHREKDMLGQQALPPCHALVYAACFPSRRGEYRISVLAPRTKPNQLESSKHPCCECEVSLGWAASFSISRRRGVAKIPWAWFSLSCAFYSSVVRLLSTYMSNVRKNNLEKEGKHCVTIPITSVALVITLNKTAHHCWNYFENVFKVRPSREWTNFEIVVVQTRVWVVPKQD